MKDCTDIRELLSARIDGELTEAESQQVDAHLASCETCRRELAVLERVWEGLGVLRDVDVPAGLAERVLRQVAVRRRRSAARRLLPRWVYPVATAAAVLVSFAIGFYLIGGGPLDPETQQIVENIEVLQNLDMLENLDVISEMGEGVLLIPGNGTDTKGGGGES